MTNDMELLCDYVARGSEEAFARLVERHVNLVYSVALRHTGNADHARDITQAVFVILARKAARLHPDTILSGWLYKTARLTAANFVRTETRRFRREQEVYMQSLSTETEPPAWEQIVPLLDTAIAGLGETDRNAVVLRFMEGKNFQEVGVALGASEEAAKMRVHRALEKLRKFFTRKGVVLSGAGLAGLMSANAVQAAPVGLAVSVTAAAVKGAALSASTLSLVKGATEIMTWTTKVKIAAGVGLAALVTYGSYEVVDQKQQVTTLQQQLEREQQTAQQLAAAQQAAMDKLKQQNQALLEERQREAEVMNKLLARQRAETDAAVAQANAARAEADAITKQKKFNAMAELWKDPGQQESRRLGYRQMFKSSFAALTRELKLSPEDTDKFIELFVDNEMKKQDRVAAMWQKTMDIKTAIQLRENDAKELERTIRSWLGDDAAAAYERTRRDIRASESVSLVNQALEEHPLTSDQSKRLWEIAGAQPDILFDSEDFFRGPTLTEALLQQYQDRADAILKAAAEFLTPEQLSAIATVSSNKIETIRTQIRLNHNLFKKTP